MVRVFALVAPVAVASREVVPALKVSNAASHLVAEAAELGMTVMLIAITVGLPLERVHASDEEMGWRLTRAVCMQLQVGECEKEVWVDIPARDRDGEVGSGSSLTGDRPMAATAMGVHSGLDQPAQAGSAHRTAIGPRRPAPEMGDEGEVVPSDLDHPLLQLLLHVRRRPPLGSYIEQVVSELSRQGDEEESDEVKECLVPANRQVYCQHESSQSRHSQGQQCPDGITITIVHEGLRQTMGVR